VRTAEGLETGEVSAKAARRTPDERAVAQSLYGEDDNVWPWRAAIAFMPALLDEALVQSAALNERRGNVRRQLRPLECG
jgi:hypothetical protein